MTSASLTVRKYQIRSEVTNRLPESVERNIEILSPSSRTGGRHDSDKHLPEKRGKSLLAAGSARRVPPVIHVRAYYVPSWFTSLGVWKKRRLIEGKGMPSTHNWRFITLTIDPKIWTDPLSGYLHGSDHMRRFLYACRQSGLWKAACKWCWKMEFQQNEYTHWHLLVSRFSRFSHDQLAKLTELWGMGRVNVKRVNEKDFSYNFKYAFKPVILDSQTGEDDEFERCAPDWFLDYESKKTVRVVAEDGSVDHLEKPHTFSRARFWQTSRGFHTKKAKPASKPKAAQTCLLPRTPRQVIRRHARTVQVFSRRSSGQYMKAQTVCLDIPVDRFWGLAGFDIAHGGGVGLGMFSFVIPHYRITSNTQEKWLLTPLIQSNRLNLRHAQHLQSMGQTLRAC